VATVCLAHFLTQAGLSQSVAPLPFIASSFTAPDHKPSSAWYSAAYSLAVGTFILPSGRFGDVYGHKRLFVIGWLWFAITSLGAGLNPRMQGSADKTRNVESEEIFFCICRALQGIGPALLMPNGLAILGRTYPEGNRKNMAFSLFGASAPVGFVVGSVMSSLLAEKTHWVWAYRALAISLPGTLASSTTTRDSCNSSDNGNPSKEKPPLWKQLDLFGTILGVSGLILINVAVNQAALVSWSTPYTYFLLVLGLLVLFCFFFLEFTPSLTTHPLIPSGLLSRDTSIPLACIGCGWATFSIWIYYIWEFLERIRALSPLLAAAQFSPAAVSGLLAAISTGYLLSKTTPQVIMVLAMCAFFTGTTLIATAPAQQIYWAQAFLSIIIMPWGMDMSFPSATILLSARAGPENQGVAMSLVNTVVNYSISIGLGLAGTVQARVDNDDDSDRLLLAGFRSTWYFAMGLSALGIVLAVTFVAMGAWTARRKRSPSSTSSMLRVGSDKIVVGLDHA
jgi:MFS family permease